MQLVEIIDLHCFVGTTATFVDTQRYLGTCYKADNWIHVGETTGQGKLSKSHQPVLSKKAVYVQPLTGNFRQKLCHAAR